jgi:hypothetical protein
MVGSPLVGFHCRLHPLPTRSSSTRRLIGWRIATHETRFSTSPSHRSGLRPSFPVERICWFCLSALECLTSLTDEMNYYALC